MNDSHAPDAPPAAVARPRVWPMYRAVVGVGFVCGFAIVAVFEVTRPVIQRNKIAMRQRAVLSVLPGAETSGTFRLAENGAFESVGSESEGSDLVFAGYDENQALVGLAFPAQGMGYQDIVRLLYSYSFETESVLGIRVLESRETPGLGDRIETDPGFLSNFGRLDVRLTADGSAIAHPIEFVKTGEKNAPWQIDAISGATITSRATAEMLRASTMQWIPRVKKREADFTSKRKGAQ